MTRTSYISAILVFGSCLLTIAAFMASLRALASFKVEMPAATLLALNLCHGPLIGVALMSVLAAALLLALRQAVGLWLSALTCLACDFVLFAATLPYIALSNTLSGGDGPSRIAGTSGASSGFPGPVWIGLAVVTTQLVLGVLILKRRELTGQRI